MKLSRLPTTRNSETPNASLQRCGDILMPPSDYGIDHPMTEGERQWFEDNVRLFVHLAKLSPLKRGGKSNREIVNQGIFGVVRGLRSWQHGKGSNLTSYVGCCFRHATGQRHEAKTFASRKITKRPTLLLGNVEPETEMRPDESRHFEDMTGRVWEAFQDAILTNNERLVVVRLLGFDGKTQTLEKTSKQMGLTRERVRQIYVKAIGKIAYRARLPRWNASRMNAAKPKRMTVFTRMVD